MKEGVRLKRKISESRRKFLSEESRIWADDGLISEDARTGIMARYAQAKRFPEIVPLLGLSMIGLGLLSFIAANWRYIPALLKVTLIICSYLGCVTGAFFLEKRGRRVAPDMLLFLSGFLLLGGLALISQAFHIEGSLSGLLLTWILVFAPTFLIVRNISIYMLYEVVSIFYLNIRYSEYAEYPGNEAPSMGPILPLVLLLFIVGAAWLICLNERGTGRAGGESKLKSFFVGGPARRIFWSNFMILNWFTWMYVINSGHESILPFVAGVLVIGILIITAGKFLGAFDLDWQGLLLVGASGIALSFQFAWSDRFWSHHAEGELLAQTLLSSIALGAYLVYRIIRRSWGSGFTTFLFCALLARWYFGMFFTFMSRSMFFISGGVILLLITFVSRKWSKLAAKNHGGDENGPAL
jgi:uncharacterized membrane protein